MKQHTWWAFYFIAALVASSSVHCASLEVTTISPLEEEDSTELLPLDYNNDQADELLLEDTEGGKLKCIFS